ncbi:dynamin family protein [Trueperella pecoris]|uniref:Dynamin family protein n=1 Tax=Trueperella pecoris TaxID=2733571 RepID=A0A7M1QWY4_9ACTO|nr:dynamin family protein [Trueperella pecoris]QOQ38875.1 ABC transporter [Trueperella pecoris]QOR46499.1 dynamin family protein [Trueperella pecoris]
MSLTEAIGDLHAVKEIVEAKMPSQLGDVGQILDKAVARRALGAQMTIVALAGATGAGKSSLLNALVGSQIAHASAIRPTTSQPLAVSNVPAAEVLDWLEIKERHEAELSHHGPTVLIDLPDIDSTEFVHRQSAQRLASLVDVVVWVLDPQKYADAVVHEDYLSMLSEHAATTIVVLNQADRLDEATLADVLADASRLAREDGLEVEILPTSATTGRGVETLRHRIDAIVAAKTAADQRLAADIRTASRSMLGRMHADGGRQASTAADVPFEPVASALAVAAGANVVARASADSHRKRARAATGWPLTRWFAKRRIDPLKRLRLDRGPQVTGVADYVSPAQLSAARGKVRAYAEAVTSHMPAAWAREARTGIAERTEAFLAGVDATIGNEDVEARRTPAWWLMFNIVQWLAVGVAVAGALWLALLFCADTLQLQLGTPPAWGIFPLPTIMLGSGLLTGWLLAGLGRFLAERGAARTRARVRARLEGAIGSRAEEAILAPLEAERGQYAHVQGLLTGLLQLG